MRLAVGGSGHTTSRSRNYLVFPRYFRSELTDVRGVPAQIGARVIVPARFTALTLPVITFRTELDGPRTSACRSLSRGGREPATVVSTCPDWPVSRPLTYIQAAATIRHALRRRPVAVIGGGNSGRRQAAVFFADTAPSYTCCAGPELAANNKRVSASLANQIVSTDAQGHDPHGKFANYTLHGDAYLTRLRDYTVNGARTRPPVRLFVLYRCAAAVGIAYPRLFFGFSPVSTIKIRVYRLNLDTETDGCYRSHHRAILETVSREFFAAATWRRWATRRLLRQGEGAIGCGVVIRSREHRGTPSDTLPDPPARHIQSPARKRSWPPRIKRARLRDQTNTSRYPCDSSRCSIAVRPLAFILSGDLKYCCHNVVISHHPPPSQ